MKIFTYDKDSVVSPKNSKNLASGRNIQIIENSNLKVCDRGLPVPVDHLRGEIFANFYALSFLK
jgi:hypothetical protein